MHKRTSRGLSAWVTVEVCGDQAATNCFLPLCMKMLLQSCLSCFLSLLTEVSAASHCKAKNLPAAGRAKLR